MNTQSNIDTKIVDFPTEENGNFYRKPARQSL